MNKLKLIPILIFASAQNALAQGEDLDAEGIVRILNRLAQFAIDAAALVLVIVAVYYGIRMATAGANADQFNDAKRSFWYALIGALVVFGVGVIISSVERFIKGT